MLRLHDTATGTVRPLEQRTEGEVSMYVCGPTVYDLPHIGHGRYNLVFDVLRRYLLFRGLTVRYVSNITDVERGASETGTASSRVLSAAQLLSNDSNRLKQEVLKFLETVRAA